jgi:hypothetical protein
LKKHLNRVPAQQRLISRQEHTSIQIAQCFQSQADSVASVGQIVEYHIHILLSAKRCNTFMPGHNDPSGKQALCGIQGPLDHLGTFSNEHALLWFKPVQQLGLCQPGVHIQPGIAEISNFGIRDHRNSPVFLLLFIISQQRYPVKRIFKLVFIVLLPEMQNVECKIMVFSPKTNLFRRQSRHNNSAFAQH